LTRARSAASSGEGAATSVRRAGPTRSWSIAPARIFPVSDAFSRCGGVSLDRLEERVELEGLAHERRDVERRDLLHVAADGREHDHGDRREARIVLLRGDEL